MRGGQAKQGVDGPVKITPELVKILGLPDNPTVLQVVARVNEVLLATAQVCLDNVDIGLLDAIKVGFTRKLEALVGDPDGKDIRVLRLLKPLMKGLAAPMQKVSAPLAPREASPSEKLYSPLEGFFRKNVGIRNGECFKPFLVRMQVDGKTSKEFNLRDFYNAFNDRGTLIVPGNATRLEWVAIRIFFDQMIAGGFLEAGTLRWTELFLQRMEGVA